MEFAKALNPGGRKRAWDIRGVHIKRDLPSLLEHCWRSLDEHLCLRDVGMVSNFRNQILRHLLADELLAAHPEDGKVRLTSPCIPIGFADLAVGGARALEL